MVSNTTVWSAPRRDPLGRPGIAGWSSILVSLCRQVSLTEIIASCAARFARCYMSLCCRYHTLLPFTCADDSCLSLCHARGRLHGGEFCETYSLSCDAFFECLHLFAVVFCLTRLYASWSAGTPRLRPVCALIDRSTRLVEPYCSLSHTSSTPGAVPSAASHDSFSRVLSLHLASYLLVD